MFYVVLSKKYDARKMLWISIDCDICIPYVKYLHLNIHLQVVKLREVFPHGNGFVLVFEYMLSDLSEVIRKAEKPLTEAQIKSYMLMLLKGVAFCHQNNIMHRVRIK